MNLRFLLIILFLLLLDAYVFWGVKTIFAKSQHQVLWTSLYAFLMLLGYVGFYHLTMNFVERPINATLVRNLAIGFGFPSVVFNLIFALFLIFGDVIRIFHYIIQATVKVFSNKNAEISFDDRRAFMVKLGLGIASIPFASLLYGITKGKYNYQVKKVKLHFSNLPKSFHGFKIVQISDIHSGSFDSVEEVQHGIDMVNEQNPDVIFFTGDLVNSDAREIEPYIDVFKKLKAPMGVFSILGNHDYGDYKQWDSPSAKKENFQLLQQHQKEMNFKLLKNEHVLLKKGSEQITLLGVENWGKPPFVTHGDLNKAFENSDPNSFKILLSHDPSHWDLKVLPHPIKVDLTLSGHTHGMQFGIDVPWLKWSPVKYKYPRWSGLYQEAKQYLYVNKGFGFLGFPGRVGMLPEITVIELFSE